MDSHHTSALLVEAANKLTQKDFDEALKHIYPRSYQFDIPPEFVKDGKVRIFVTGCQGSGDESQKAVAALMKKVASTDGEPLFRVFAGDNLYSAGATHPVTDTHFNDAFHNIYDDDIPSFFVLGNHDENFHKPSLLARTADTSYIPGVSAMAHKIFGSSEVGWSIGKNEVLHGLLPTSQFTFELQIEKFLKPELHRNKLSAWNMPASDYSLALGQKELFFINSNRFFIELIDYFTKFQFDKERDPKENPIIWFKQQYDKAIAEGRYPILITHHPANITLGKQMVSPDTKQYIDDETCEKYNHLVGLDLKTRSFTEMLHKGLLVLDINAPLKINAHNHFLNWICDPNDGCQLTAGGGGGRLQEFYKLDHPYSGCQLEQHGFAVLTIPLKNETELDKIIDVDFYTTDGLHLKFNTTSSEPIRDKEKNSAEFENLRNKVIAASQAYYAKLPLPSKGHQTDTKKTDTGFFGAVSQKLSAAGKAVGDAYESVKKYFKKEPGRVQDIVGYFDQYQIPVKKEIIAYHLQDIAGFFDQSQVPITQVVKGSDYQLAKAFLQEKITVLTQQFPVTDQSFVSFLRDELPELFVTMDEQNQGQEGVFGYRTFV